MGDPSSDADDDRRAPPLTPLERASGMAIGSHPVDLETHETPSTARAALEQVTTRFLTRAPCVVSFSGGRDSSAVLAVAAHVARREGLPLPIPFTLRFPESPSAEESDWQQLVIDHLGLTDWERADLHDELSILGDVAQRCLTQVGLFWPPNAYIHSPIFAAARGGTVLTGLDGDGLFGDWRWCHAQAVLHGRVRPRPRDAIRVGVALAPKSARRLAMRRRSAYVPKWLLPQAGAAYNAFVVGRVVEEPRRWDRRVEWYAQGRALYLTQRNLELIGALDDVEVGHPLLHPEFLAALIREGGAAGFGDRTDAMRHLVGDLLPTEIIERRGKAAFGEALWSHRARGFAALWAGGGVDQELVDPERLRAAWTGEHPIFHSLTLLNEAWLASATTTVAGASTGQETPAQEK